MSNLDEILNQFNIFSKGTGSGKNTRNANEADKALQAMAQAGYTAVYSVSDTVQLEKLQSTVTNSVKRRYYPYINNLAQVSPKQFWHLYDGNHIGETRYALYSLDLQSTGSASTFNLGVRLKRSNLVVPLTPLQATPGPTGKTVQARHKFYNKAMVMEYGLPTVIKPLGDHALAFGYSGNLIFRGPTTGTGTPLTIKINREYAPTKGALTRATDGFFRTVATVVVDKIANKYAARVAEASGQAAVVNINVGKPYSNATAKATARRIANSLVVEEV